MRWESRSELILCPCESLAGTARDRCLVQGATRLWLPPDE